VRFRSGLQPLAVGQTLQLLIGAVITVLSAEFWVNHVSTPQLSICGLVLQLYGIMFIAFAVRDLVLIRQIDYDAPIIMIQKQVAKLRAWHIRAAIWYGYTGSVVWLPALIVVLYLLGVRWDQSPRKILWLVASTLVGLALNYSLVRLARSPGKCGRALSNSWIGRSVNRAQAALDEIEQFERDVA
jgi:hypothetical protein